MRRLPTARHALGAVTAVALAAALAPAGARANSLFEALSGSEEITYSLLSTKTTDAFGTTTRIDSQNYGSRSHLRLNYNLLPQLNLNTGGTFEKNFSDFSSGEDSTETEITRIRPYAWLTLRDPVIGGAVGYDRSDDTTETSGRQSITLTREAYNTNLLWRPLDLPATQARFTRTSTRDAERVSVDTDVDQLFVKSEYGYRGFNAHYAGNWVAAQDNIRDLESSLTSHEGKALLATTLFDGRVSFATDNRIRFTEITLDRRGDVAPLESTSALQQPAAAGLSALDDTPLTGALGANPALIDGDTTTSAGVNIGFVGVGAPRRNIGLDLGSAVAVNSLRVWVTGFTPPLPADITNFFSWDIYTSSDNLNWTFHTTVAPAGFGPFDQRFVIDFPAVTTRYIKAVTLPLPGGIVGSTDSSAFPNILVTEVQAFSDRTVGAARADTRQTISQTFRTHNVDVKTILLKAGPLLYHRVNADYRELEPDGTSRYNVSNGLFVTHRLSPIFSTSANVSYELGSEREETRRSVLYYASLAATPLPTLTDSLVVSGNRQWVGAITTTSDSAVLYNTAQLYRGIDATLNLGAVLTTEEQEDTAPLRRREYYVNAGTGITPHPRLSVTTYYVGRLTRATGGGLEEARETTENRLDLTLSFTPFHTLSVSASANIQSQTDQDTRVTQNYSASWAPFQDGSLQFTFFYAESRLPDDVRSRIVQPSVRWYLTARRRSYLEATYQFNTTESSALKSESQLFSTSLVLAY